MEPALASLTLSTTGWVGVTQSLEERTHPHTHPYTLYKAFSQQVIYVTAADISTKVRPVYCTKRSVKVLHVSTSGYISTSPTNLLIKAQKKYCTLTLRVAGKYPFDTQICDIRYLTWMHTNRTLSVGPEFEEINLDAQLPNGEWDITMVSVTCQSRGGQQPRTACV